MVRVLGFWCIEAEGLELGRTLTLGFLQLTGAMLGVLDPRLLGLSVGTRALQKPKTVKP